MAQCPMSRFFKILEIFEEDPSRTNAVAAIAAIKGIEGSFIDDYGNKVVFHAIVGPLND